MYFQQILHQDLGCASYLVADLGEAAVIDPKWEIREYLEAVDEAEAEICHVFETHLHADHVSGRRRLIAATGAQAHVPAGRGRRGVDDGDLVRIGGLELVALATPGHRPEHVSYLLYAGDAPRHLFSGDSLLVGDVARPDLAVPAVEGARALWQTLSRLLALGDEVEVWPAHVGGSLCASRSASSATSSTIGQERHSNPLLSIADPAAFTAELTRSTPTRPPAAARVVGLNLRGAADQGPVPEFDAHALRAVLGESVPVVDIRDPEDFDTGHLDGSINLPARGRGLGTRAGWAVGADRPFMLVSPSLESGRRVADLLRAAGLRNVSGMSVADPEVWAATGLDVRAGRAVTPDRLAAPMRAGEVTLIDVRDSVEWTEGHILSSRSLPLSELSDCAELALEHRSPSCARAAHAQRSRRAFCDSAGTIPSGASAVVSISLPRSGCLWWAHSCNAVGTKRVDD